MSDFDLNLSTRPFPAYRLTNAALVCLLVVLAAVSIWQTSGFFRYTELGQSIRTEEQETRVEAEALGKRVAELESRLDRPESTAKLNEIGFLNHLILRKSLSWTRLFAVLEDIVPENVHFTKLTPNITADGTITLDLGIRGRTMGDITEFLQRIEKSPMFEKINVKVEQKAEDRKEQPAAMDVDVTLTTVYYPQRDSQ